MWFHIVYIYSSKLDLPSEEATGISWAYKGVWTNSIGGQARHNSAL